jgi:hypothetical protein
LIYSDVIEQSVAPAFLLGAVASFLSVLNIKNNRLVDQRRTMGRAEPDADLAARRKVLSRRGRLLRRATLFAILSAATAAALIVMSFAYSLFAITEQHGLPALFTLSLVFLGLSFVAFGHEVLISQGDFQD